VEKPFADFLADCDQGPAQLRRDFLNEISLAGALRPGNHKQLVGREIQISCRLEELVEFSLGHLRKAQCRKSSQAPWEEASAKEAWAAKILDAIVALPLSENVTDPPCASSISVGDPSFWRKICGWFTKWGSAA
jgi:hypothetical protein